MTLAEIMGNSFANYFGPGSRGENIVPVKTALPGLLLEYDILSVNDAGCGLCWIQEILADSILYRGFDILEREGAEVLDITCEVMPKADLIICRDVLFHLTNELVDKSLENFKNSKYLLATSCYDTDNNERETEFKNKAINSRLNLIPLLGEPLDKIEESFDNRFMGLWKL